MAAADSLVDRFRRRLRGLDVLEAGGRVAVAVSGGRDSVVLLHLLRFGVGFAPERLVVLHCDHAMRPESAGDARWLRGLCRAWGVEFRWRRAESAPRSEAAARAWRYAALREMAAEAGAVRLLTAHHADDQAETVLFRVLRGAGVAGLAGIPAARPDGVLRPLLPFWRAELRDYARAARLRWRDDVTNRSRGPARNRIRHEILPRVEATFAPGARRALARLAALTAREDAAWRRLTRAAAARVLTEDADAILLSRTAWRRLDPALRARVLRDALSRLGVVPSAHGTRIAVQFITAADSGRELQLPGGVRARVEFETVRVERSRGAMPDCELRVAPPAGSGEFWVGGERRVITWGFAPDGDAAPAAGAIRFSLAAVPMPLTVRGWRPGDRIRTPAGTKRLKKLFVERRIGRTARERAVVVADAARRVVCVAGVAQDPATCAVPGEATLFLQIA